MSQWESRFTKKALAALSSDEAWRDRVQQVLTGTGPRVHLAIFVEPFLEFVLNGKKTVESRFSVNRCPPYEHVSRGDIVLLKRASGPVVGACVVSAVWSYRLDRGSWAEIRRTFATALCAQDPEFWKARKRASYATLMQLGAVRGIPEMSVRKRDRRGWVVLYDRQGFLPGMEIGDIKVAGIIAISGSRKSGKTTTGTAVASALGWRRTGFGDYVRAEAIRLGASTDRPTLRDLGATMLRELGPQQFTRRTLAAAGWRAGEALVIDGVRHVEVLDALQEIVSPLPVMLVFIEAADDVRAARLTAADASVSESVAVGDRHSTEVQVETLVRARADLVVSGEGSVEASVSVVLDVARSKFPGL